MADQLPIVSQLKEYCECLSNVKDDEIAELVNLISLATCWMRKPCETFLKSERTEVIDLPSCMDCPMEFYPFYHPFDVESFKFYLVTIDGISETSEEITEVAYSPTLNGFRLQPLPSCKCKGNVCGCEPQYKLLVTYSAGYDTIPDCLLPVFCNVLEVIQAKNDCSCEDCGCDESKYEDHVEYAKGDVVTVALETDIGRLLVSQYKKQLGMISLCETASELWGFIV